MSLINIILKKGFVMEKRIDCEQLVEVDVGKTDLLFKLLIQKMTAIHGKLEQ